MTTTNHFGNMLPIGVTCAPPFSCEQRDTTKAYVTLFNPGVPNNFLGNHVISGAGTVHFGSGGTPMPPK
jgi:hypothetical protein